MNKALNSLAHNNNQYKYPYLLLCLYLTFLLATVCVASKVTLIGSYLEPGGIYVFAFTFIICDIVGEVYGYAYPRLFIWIGILCQFIFALTLTLICHLPTPENYLDNAHAYHVVFDPSLRYVFSGLAALLVGEFVNVYLLAKWKIKFKGRFFVLRSLFSTAIGQALLTIIADILIFTGKIPLNNMISIMINGYIWKLVFAIIFVFPAWLLVRWLKRVEKMDYFDINTNFNPFIFSLKESTAYSNDLKPAFNNN